MSNNAIFSKILVYIYMNILEFLENAIVYLVSSRFDAAFFAVLPAQSIKHRPGMDAIILSLSL